MKKYVLIIFLLNAAKPAISQTYFNRLYDYDGGNFSNHATTSIELANGDFLIAGNKFFPNFSALHYIRINNVRDTVIVKRYPTVNNGYYTAIGNSLIRCSDNQFAQTGSITGAGISYDMLLVKLTEYGDTLWTKKYGGVNSDLSNTICQTTDSGFVLMGSTQSFSNGSASDFYLIKTDKHGNQQWLCLRFLFNKNR